MKAIYLMLVLLMVQLGAHAQVSDFLNRAKNRAKAKMVQKADNKVDQQVDRELDALDGPAPKKENDPKPQPKKAEKSSPETPKNSKSGSNETQKSDTAAGEEGLKSYSKFDFIAGDKIIASEDFIETNIGDFPDKWYTNGSAEVVTLNKFPGKWLKIYNTKTTSFIPEFVKSLPDHFTLEYDFIFQVDQTNNKYQHFLSCAIVQANKLDEKITTDIVGNYGMSFTVAGGATYHYDYKIEQISGNTYGNISANKKPGVFVNANAGKIFHVSMWRQGPRLRIYLNGDKIFDLPRMFNGQGDLNQIRFFSSIDGPDEAFYLSNLRLATGAPDTRNKLITEGKWTTRGILFDVNSDLIKGESYGVLKELSQVLQENETVKVKIIGHTDSDGDDKKNLQLSQKRAIAVKNALVNEFGIAATRLDTDGKGESEPADNNNTKEGKSNNRRVEFIKL